MQTSSEIYDSTEGQQMYQPVNKMENINYSLITNNQ